MPIPEVELAMSRTIGHPSRVGTATAQGLVPTTASVAPQGAISGPALVKTRPMQARSVASSAKKPAAPRCVLSPRDRAADPLRLSEVERQSHRPRRRDAAVGPASVEHPRRAGAGDLGDLGAGIDQPVTDAVDVLREALHP